MPSLVGSEMCIRDSYTMFQRITSFSGGIRPIPKGIIRPFPKAYAHFRWSTRFSDGMTPLSDRLRPFLMDYALFRKGFRPFPMHYVLLRWCTPLSERSYMPFSDGLHPFPMDCPLLQRDYTPFSDGLRGSNGYKNLVSRRSRIQRQKAVPRQHFVYN